MNFKALPPLPIMSPLVTYGLIGLAACVLLSACRQLFFRSKTEPPAVFHWVPYIGSAVSYGMDPVAFFEKYRAKVCLPLETYVGSRFS